MAQICDAPDDSPKSEEECSKVYELAHTDVSKKTSLISHILLNHEILLEALNCHQKFQNGNKYLRSEI